MTPLSTRKVEPVDGHEMKAALRSLLFLRRKMQSAADSAIDTSHIHPDFRASACNLLSYLALRRHDIRLLQTRLAKLGLSSLGRCESNVQVSVDRVIDLLQRLLPEEDHETPPYPRAEWEIDEHALQNHGTALFGPPPADRNVRIMVTMPSEAATDYDLVERQLAAGMNCQRINCAHDEPAVWLKMIEHLHKAMKKLGKPCQVVMDLAGPKLRTGPVAPGPSVMRIRPDRDQYGRVTLPARVWLSHEQSSDSTCLRLQVPRKWLAQLQIDDILDFKDARQSKRKLHIVEVGDEGCWADLHKTAYMVPGTVLKLRAPHGRKKSAPISAVPALEQSIKLEEGDVLILTRDNLDGYGTVRDDNGEVLLPARISCTSAAVFDFVREGEPVWFDDGKIGGAVVSCQEGELHVQIHHAPNGAKLRADKGINFPLSALALQALSADDIVALKFACKHADIVELSYVNRGEDVRALLAQMERFDAAHLGIVLKIETRCGFENLPELILAGMQNPRLGVMIARGDLAVETGFERTAELQEEMLCLCEAAHVPVIWATQVLETLAKTGAPTRAEITDAAMGVRAECVMLNKGPHIIQAIATLDDLLRRMQTHHNKKRDMMRKLRVAHLPSEPIALAHP